MRSERKIELIVIKRRANVVTVEPTHKETNSIHRRQFCDSDRERCLFSFSIFTTSVYNEIL